MTIKENLIQLIVEMDETQVKKIEKFANQLLWDNVPEEEATPEEIEIFEMYEAGHEDYQPLYTIEDIEKQRKLNGY